MKTAAPTATPDQLRRQDSGGYVIDTPQGPRGYADETPNSYIEGLANSPVADAVTRDIAQAVLARRAHDREVYINANHHAQPPHVTPVYRDGDRLVAVDGDLRQGFRDGVSDEDLADLARNGYWVGRAAQAVLARRHRERAGEAV